MRILFKTSYLQDIKLLKHNGYVFWYGVLLLAVLIAPAVLDEFYIGEMAFIFIYAIAGLGLMIPSDSRDCPVWVTPPLWP